MKAAGWSSGAYERSSRAAKMAATSATARKWAESPRNSTAIANEAIGVVEGYLIRRANEIYVRAGRLWSSS